MRHDDVLATLPARRIRLAWVFRRPSWGGTSSLPRYGRGRFPVPPEAGRRKRDCGRHGAFAVYVGRASCSGPHVGREIAWRLDRGAMSWQRRDFGDAASAHCGLPQTGVRGFDPGRSPRLSTARAAASRCRRADGPRQFGTRKVGTSATARIGKLHLQRRFAAPGRIGPYGPRACRLNGRLASRSRIAFRQAGSRSAIRATPGDIVALPDAPRFLPRAWRRKRSGVAVKSGSVERVKPKMFKTRRFDLRKRRKSA